MNPEKDNDEDKDKDGRYPKCRELQNYIWQLKRNKRNPQY